MFDQIGDSVEILAIGQAHQFDARRMAPQPRLSRVERIVNIARHRLRIRSDTFFRSVIRHVLVDVAGQFLQGPIAVQRAVIFAFDTLAIAPVAFDADVPEYLPPVRLSRAKRP